MIHDQYIRPKNAHGDIYDIPLSRIELPDLT